MTQCWVGSQKLDFNLLLLMNIPLSHSKTNALNEPQNEFKYIEIIA
jgi:hypothetical protein